MFTGIVAELGTVVEAGAGRLVITCTEVLADAGLGDSIAVNGCCLTVVERGADWWRADLSAETLRRTALGELVAGDVVNLERPARLGGRLDGHLVTGHVDGIGRVLSPAPDLRVSLPDDLARYVVAKGSIAVDGVSLTVVEPDDHSFGAAIIPHTASVTTLGRRAPGDAVHLEADVTAKHVERLLAWRDERLLAWRDERLLAWRDER
ncbi:riboflavin synthase [Naumannella cuiyingiana]|uniref:Riboflavin synthase n=1 Tax=Naumannella cuiyingiana TaxID=1347891 RepID=A0A7Z0D7A4_9ACTN|nr:riboflavin synthase [Naumannella cuiyingiana]NYI70170.1 riboflavin synthase [Naumannella cuiyingiana]